MLTDFINNLKVVAVQVIILYLISGIGFIADKTKIFVQADGKRLVDLLFNLILPIAIVNSFLSMERTPEHIRGLLISFALAVLHKASSFPECERRNRNRYNMGKHGESARIARHEVCCNIDDAVKAANYLLTYGKVHNIAF